MGNIKAHAGLLTTCSPS